MNETLRFAQGDKWRRVQNDKHWHFPNYDTVS
jgi:hypothetical protein